MWREIAMLIASKCEKDKQHSLLTNRRMGFLTLVVSLVGTVLSFGIVVRFGVQKWKKI